jgi:hypothetical protein
MLTFPCHQVLNIAIEEVMDTEEGGTAEAGMGEPERLLGSGCLGGFSDCSLLCSTLLRSTRLWLRPCSSRTHHLVLV